MDNNRDMNQANDYKEETSAEFVEPSAYSGKTYSDDKTGAGATWGYIGIVFGILSMFWMPTTFALVAIVLGAVGLWRKSTTLGITAIAIGAISLFIQLFWTSFSWM